MGDERRINQLTAKAYSDIGSSDYFAVDNASEAESKKLPASAIKDGINGASTTANTASTNATRALNIARSTSSFPTGDAYSSSSAYKVGDMVIYNNTLYRCKTACSAASWSVNANNFESISLASAITDLNNELSDIQDIFFNISNISGFQDRYVGYGVYHKKQNTVSIYVGFRNNSSAVTSHNIGRIPTAYRPKTTKYGVGTIQGADTNRTMSNCTYDINTDGAIYNNLTGAYYGGMCVAEYSLD